MDKINLLDKFIHSINWAEPSNPEYLERLRNILKCGYLLTPEQSGHRTYYPTHKDKIFFAVHPLGELSKDYPENKDSLACFSDTNGYHMASNGLFFIFNSKLREEYVLKPVTYKYECATTTKVDLYKYLEGIGNAGYTIASDLIYCYYYIKYANGEIPASKIIEVVQERNLRTELSSTLKQKSIEINSRLSPEYNLLPRVLSKKPEDLLLYVKNYYEIVNILNELDIKIDLYDKYGYYIDPQTRINKVYEMYKYVEQNKDIKLGTSYLEMEESYKEKIKELCLIAKQQRTRL